MKKVILTTVGALAIVVCLLLAVAYTGAVDVGASRDHMAGVHWFLDTVQIHSIQSRARDVPEGIFLTDSSRIEKGLAHYRSMCVTCHGAPGVQPSEIGRGLNPAPPDLSQRFFTAGENFWIVKHGIRMTGMPAFGETHSDEDLWAIVAFLEKLPELSERDYARLAGAEASGDGSRHAHEHSPGGADAHD